MAEQLARRADQVSPFRVMHLLERAKQLEAAGRSIVHLEIGEPDFPTPAPIVAAGQRALAAGHTQYTPARGLPQLRQAIADFYGERFGIDLDPERILLTPGASGGLQLLLMALFDPGEAVLLPEPGYPCNRQLVSLLGGRVHSVAVGPETRYQLQADQVPEERDLRLVLVASPANPTGACLEPEGLRQLYERVRAQGMALLVDELYQGLNYETAPHTALACGEAGLYVVNSFSKYFGMTGWRLGWIVAPREAVPVLDRLAQNLYLAPPTLSQYAALAAFTPETLAILEERRRIFQQRRDFLRSALEKLGFRFPAPPHGAFYLYADVRQLTEDSARFAEELLEQQGVALTPGLDFETRAPERAVRFAYTQDLNTLAEGVARIERFLGG